MAIRHSGEEAVKSVTLGLARPFRDSWGAGTGKTTSSAMWLPRSARCKPTKAGRQLHLRAQGSLANPPRVSVDGGPRGDKAKSRPCCCWTRRASQPRRDVLYAWVGAPPSDGEAQLPRREDDGMMGDPGPFRPHGLARRPDRVRALLRLARGQPRRDAGRHCLRGVVRCLGLGRDLAQSCHALPQGHLQV